jgi:hypothetical protein
MRESVCIFDAKIVEKLGDISKDHNYNLNDDVDLPDYVTPEYSPVEPESVMPEADVWDSDAYDQYITAQVLIPKDGHEILNQVIWRKRDSEGNPIGKGNSNPILDTRLYQVMFPDGNVAEYSANVITECI